MQTLSYKKNPSRYFPKDLGLMGPEQEVAKAQLCVAKSLSRLYDGLRACGLGHEDAISRTAKAIGITEDMAVGYLRVYRNYQEPANPNRLKFEYYFLFTIEMSKLYHFLPVLNAYYNDSTGTVRQRVALTPKSIELKVQVSERQYGWVHLTNLSPDDLSRFKEEILQDPKANAKNIMPEPAAPVSPPAVQPEPAVMPDAEPDVQDTAPEIDDAEPEIESTCPQDDSDLLVCGINWGM